MCVCVCVCEKECVCLCVCVCMVVAFKRGDSGVSLCMSLFMCVFVSERKRGQVKTSHFSFHSSSLFLFFLLSSLLWELGSLC